MSPDHARQTTEEVEQEILEAYDLIDKEEIVLVQCEDEHWEIRHKAGPVSGETRAEVLREYADALES